MRGVFSINKDKDRNFQKNDFPKKNARVTEDFILFNILLAIFLLTAQAAERMQCVFTRRIGNRRNREFANHLIVEKELGKYF